MVLQQELKTFDENFEYPMQMQPVRLSQGMETLFAKDSRQAHAWCYQSKNLGQILE